MIQVQARIKANEESNYLQLELDLLAREDANPLEAKIAVAIEELHKAVFESFKERGLDATIEIIKGLNGGED